ncbi:PaaI family thioesterase [Palleronia caenipelagi]|uniref:PaaI family thioesterase n=1 Tax=Palleronia caenipelagi TaxID=2489174 RepID=A0A547Q7F0_9RHOB|nr:PaaI family thioesterase [Palleronia caenipelagi]TRD22291.1 PaaI family thioesterase [Palleronia caenipelagi]
MSDSQPNVQRFIDALPHACDLGLQAEPGCGGGVARMSMPYDPKIVGDPRSGVIHGGAVSALMDTCSGAAVLSHPDYVGATATLDLRIDYMRPATPGQTIHARAECYHVTRSVAFVRVTAHDDLSDPPVASGHGAFTMTHGAKS